MKKLDLHIHTKSTISDAPFNFSITKLMQYVEEMKIDAIAITYHNLFDLLQYYRMLKRSDSRLWK